MRDLLDWANPADLEPVFSSLRGQLLRVKHLASYWLLDYRYIVPTNGSENADDVNSFHYQIFVKENVIYQQISVHRDSLIRTCGI